MEVEILINNNNIIPALAKCYYIFQEEKSIKKEKRDIKRTLRYEEVGEK